MRENRKFNELRDIKVSLNYTRNPKGSVLISFGETKVICTAMIEDRVPFFLKGKSQGWLSCEYSMLPGATSSRKQRDISRGKIDGRSSEIQRLIGRSLRSVLDLTKIGERTIWIDCDVISADGGTRTASINGAYMALELAVKNAIKENIFKENPIKNKVAAISVGIVKNQKLLDLDFKEDSSADVDLNVVLNDDMEIVEIQGTSEGKTFSRRELDELLDLAELGIMDIFELQNKYLYKEKIVLSSDNEHKIQEFNNILKYNKIELLSKSDVNLSNIEVEENGNTLEENAYLKAMAIKQKCKFASISDDTGLFVEALNGEPGVFSARYSKGHDDKSNRELLLKNLENIENRKAYFKTVIVFIDKRGSKHTFEGVCEGSIAKNERGDNSFGYDCIFIPEGYDKTFGEMSEEEKNNISHRKKAIEEFKKFLENRE